MAFLAAWPHHELRAGGPASAAVRAAQRWRRARQALAEEETFEVQDQGRVGFGPLSAGAARGRRWRRRRRSRCRTRARCTRWAGSTRTPASPASCPRWTCTRTAATRRAPGRAARARPHAVRGRCVACLRCFDGSILVTPSLVQRMAACAELHRARAPHAAPSLSGAGAVRGLTAHCKQAWIRPCAWHSRARSARTGVLKYKT
jgi:hypothetical protein